MSGNLTGLREGTYLNDGSGGVAFYSPTDKNAPWVYNRWVGDMVPVSSILAYDATNQNEKYRSMAESQYQRFLNNFDQSSGGGGIVNSDTWSMISNIDNGLGFVVGGLSESLGNYLHSRADVQSVVGWNEYTGGNLGKMLIKGVPVSKSFLNGAAKTLKVGGGVLGGVGFAMTGYEIYTGEKSLVGEGGLDLIMGGVAFIPGWGWVVSGAYFGGKALLEYTGNDFWNEP
ncbi:hypothetical protein LVD15_03930 [Fulvivirga maritima]|uniref:hypothetical protein n=1 Tax=Fulvivirga maritima TaxID=2904247 RepID=UPI001F196215|nr:hypothetical protein [Fulvivirga maritima]UII27585.1 hypothetical protein LVD15_03930 [Fulvivirga maritima]